jgi:N utilization substance protein B
VENKEVIRRRQKARKILVQALYQWQLNHCEVTDLIAQYLSENNTEKFDVDYFSNLLRGIITDLETIDDHITPLLDRSKDMLNPIEMSVLRLSTYEFIHCIEIPFRVIIDEAISLTKTYGATEGHRYVNGVLHHLAAKLRSVEVEHVKNQSKK